MPVFSRLTLPRRYTYLIRLAFPTISCISVFSALSRSPVDPSSMRGLRSYQPSGMNACKCVKCHFHSRFTTTINLQSRNQSLSRSLPLETAVGIKSIGNTGIIARAGVQASGTKGTRLYSASSSLPDSCTGTLEYSSPVLCSSRIYDVFRQDVHHEQCILS